MPTKDKYFEEYSALATLPLRDVVVYPHMVLPLFVGRPKSIAALEAAMANDDPVFLLAQLDPNTEDPKAEDLHQTGTVAQVLQVLKLPDGTVKVLVMKQADCFCPMLRRLMRIATRTILKLRPCAVLC